MPKSIRDVLKTNCARVIKHSLTNHEYLERTKEVFADTHPDQLAKLNQIQDFNNACILATQLFMMETWSIPPEDVEKWF